MQRTRSAIAVALLLLACSRSESSGSARLPDEGPAVTRRTGVQSPTSAVTIYRLVTVGGQALPYGADSSFDRHCISGLRAMQYELSEERWAAEYTMFERCADGAAQAESTWVHRDTGVFVLRGDTIRFDAVAPKAHEPRILLLGLLRSDTLKAWGSDLDGGDYVFVAEKRPRSLE